jgi:hypothetical protein
VELSSVVVQRMCACSFEQQKLRSRFYETENWNNTCSGTEIERE